MKEIIKKTVYLMLENKYFITEIIEINRQKKKKIIIKNSIKISIIKKTYIIGYQPRPF